MICRRPLAADYPVAEPEVEINSDDPATLLLHVGTEAAPKGVLNSHLNYFAVVMSALSDLKVTSADRIIGGIPSIMWQPCISLRPVSP